MIAMKMIPVGEPCHNFSIMGGTIIPHDPYDGREKLVLSNYAADNIGSIHIVDVETLEGESYAFPNDSGAWALMWLEERGELLLGTCDHWGSLHCFLMKERRFLEPLRVESETYLWTFARGGDGCVYAGTFPGCKLLRYDPEKRELADLGKVGDEPENRYSRWVHSNADGNILVSVAHARRQIWLYDVKSGDFRQVGEEGENVRGVGPDFVCVENGETIRFLDPYTFAQLGVPVHPNQKEEYGTAVLPSIRAYLDDIEAPDLPDLPKGIRGNRASNGVIVGALGQEVYRVAGGKTQFRKIPGSAPATAIMTLAGEGDILWGSCENGQTIFRFDPATGEYANSNCVTSHGGEVYGIVPLNGKVFLTAYAGGDHIVYDPSLPWDQRGNVNPKTLRSVGPDLIRPNAKTVLGADGGLWTGWYAAYGRYGGGISRIDPDTYEVKSWLDIVPEQSIEHIAAGKDSLFAVTSGVANGLPTREDEFCLLKLDTQCRILAKRSFPKGVTFYRVAAVDGRVYVTAADHRNDTSCLLLFSEDTLDPLGEVPLGGADRAPTDLLMLPGRLLLFDEKGVRLYSLPDCRLMDECPAAGTVHTSTVLKNGAVYCASRRTVYRIDWE